MRYFSLSEIILAFPVFLFLGAVSAFIRGGFSVICDTLASFSEFVCYIRAKTLKKPYKIGAESRKGKFRAVIFEICEAVFFMSLGIVYTVGSYASADGMPRLYTFVIFLCSFMLSGKLLKKPISFISGCISSILVRTVFLLISAPVLAIIKLSRKFQARKANITRQKILTK